MRLEEFQRVGSDLFLRGLVSSHGGNLSVRFGDRLMITRRGAQLGHLTEHDLVETGLDWNDRATPSASSELAIHRAIYQGTQAQAIVHAHPVYAVALSLLSTQIVPVDAEGRRGLEVVPVVGESMIVQVRDVVEAVALGLREHRAVLVKGHGSFAVGQLLEEAHRWTSLLEESCRMIAAARLLAAISPRNRNKKQHRNLPAVAVLQ